jgi:opacity protein-like surface antigen
MFKQILITTSFILILIGFTANSAFSQIGLGVTYEIRDEKPTNGFGVHAQLALLNLPMVSVSARAHYSNYSEDNSLTVSNIRYNQEIKSSEFGATALVSVGLGLLSPYVGLGIGWQNFTVESALSEQIADDFNITANDEENAAKYYGVIGAAVSPIPLLRPFIEYRYAGITKDNLGPSSHGTWVFGLQIRF